MVALLTPNAKQQFFDNAGQPAAGFKLHTYAAGTATPQATYTDRAGLVANTNPIILDARGEAVLYLTPGQVYDYVLHTAADSLVWTREDVVAETEDLVLRGDLGAEDGGSRVGVVQTGDGAQAEEILTAYRRVVSPEQFGAVGNGTSDDTAKLQAALDRAAGGTLKLTPGRIYGIGSALEIPTGTTLDATGATIKRVANSDNMIRGKMDGVTGGYGAATDYRIVGGLWDGNGSTYTTACTLIAVGHSQRVDIIGITTQNVPTFHHIEINSSRDVRVVDCTFIGGNEQALQGNEAIQIDHSYSGSGTWFTPYDNTICQNITIENCTFLDTGTGVGTHSGSSLGSLGLKHDTITINNCRFYNPYYCAVRAENWSGLTVSNCRASGGAYGILCQAFGTQIMSGPVITGNQFYGMGGNGYPFSDCRAIRLLGITGFTAYYQRFAITGNMIADLVANGASIATHGITADYCQNGVIGDNICNNLRGAGIYAFNVQWVNIVDNVVRGGNSSATATWAGIVLGNSASVRCNARGNITNTMRVANLDRGLVQGNQVTDAGGLTTASNTNTTVSLNLVDATYA